MAELHTFSTTLRPWPLHFRENARSHKFSVFVSSSVCESKGRGPSFLPWMHDSIKAPSPFHSSLGREKLSQGSRINIDLGFNSKTKEDGNSSLEYSYIQ